MLKYTQAYTMFKEMIADGRLRRGDRMPSIRRAAELYRISRTTVQNAYFQLAAEGYIYAKPQSGYFVAGGPKAPAAPMPRPQVQTPPRLDLTGNSADLSSFDFSLWQRYIKSALRQRQRLLTYSEPQGEYDLRCALADYVRERRNVVTAPEHIVIGAGVQMLLEILCVLLKGRRTVSFPDGSFVQGSTVFAAHGYTVRTRYKDADIIYVSPSHMNRQGDVMPIQRRLELCAHSADTGAVVIEDDFENDFLYSSTPTPSLYALGCGRHLPSNERHLCPNRVQDGADCPVRLPAGREYEVPHQKNPPSVHRQSQDPVRPAGKGTAGPSGARGRKRPAGAD